MCLPEGAGADVGLDVWGFFEDVFGAHSMYIAVSCSIFTPATVY